ncbi:MAG: hypothetical protein RLQ12_22800 [Cyclobacteriaceae bacterium]
MEEQKFRIGEVVYENSHPGQKLVITKADGKLYSCKLQDDMKRPAVVYSERDLKRV